MPGPLIPRSGIRAVLFDLYGTLVDIWTDEHRPEVWEALARFLRYRGLAPEPSSLQTAFFSWQRRVQAVNDEAHPEIDLTEVFRLLLDELGCRRPRTASVELSQLFRALTMLHCRPFPDAHATLSALRERFRLAVVSDAQRVFLEPEMEMTGLAPLLDVVVVSSDYGYRKPDTRLFSTALARLGVAAGEAVHVGDNLRRDVEGALRAGITAVHIVRDGGGVAGDEGDPAGARPTVPDVTVASLEEVGRWLGC